MIEHMVCQVKGFLNKYVNDVRHEKCGGEKFPEPSQIPPTKDELRQHVKCVNYKVFVWKSALEATQEVHEAHQHGCGEMDGLYKFQWMDNQTAPEKILELVVCDCKKGKCTEQC